MKKRKLRTTSHRFGVAVSVLLLLVAGVTSCSKLEDPNALPNGEYPITLTAAVEGLTAEKAATRATSDNAWAGSEEVAIRIGSEVKKYVAATDGVLSVAGGVGPFYWQSTANITVTAWHPYSSVRPVSFTVKANQSGEGYQQSDLIYASQSVKFAEKKLAFKHLPAKVVVNLKKGDGVTETEIMNATVSIVNQNLTSGTIADDWSVVQTTTGSSAITPNVLSSAASGYQKSVQALLVPQQTTASAKFIKVTVGSQEFYYSTTPDFAAGKQYTYNITVQKNGLTVTASGATVWTGTTSDVESKDPQQNYAATDLKMGDYYYSDGTWSDGGYRRYPDGSSAMLPIMPVLTGAGGVNRTVIGIVLKVGRDKGVEWKDNCEYKQKNSSTTMSTIQGYVLALHDANGGGTCEWSSYETKVDHTDMNREGYTGFYGYKNTNAIKKFAADNSMTFETAFPAAYNASESYEASSNAPNNSSGWFLPSAGQCNYWYKNKAVLLESFKKATGNSGYKWKDYYWSSSENTYGPEYSAYYLNFRGDSGILMNNKNLNFSVRSVLAF